MLKENDWEKCTLFDVNFKPENMSVTELEQGFRDLAEKIYSAEFTQHRRSQYKSMLRQVYRSKS